MARIVTTTSGRALRDRFQQDCRQFVRHFELDEMSAGQCVHRPTQIVLQLVVEPREARGLRGQDIHLPFDAINAARELHRLGDGGERLRRAFSLPKRDHIRTFEAEASRRSWRYQPVLARQCQRGLRRCLLVTIDRSKARLSPRAGEGRTQHATENTGRSAQPQDDRLARASDARFRQHKAALSQQEARGCVEAADRRSQSSCAPSSESVSISATLT